MKDSYESMEELQKDLQKMMHAQNTTPSPERDNLTPLDMHQILYNTFGKESPVGFRTVLPLEVLDRVPFLNLVCEYLSQINTVGTLKLTAKGNLPQKLCFELYGKKIITEEFIESGLIKLRKEADSIVLQNIKIICNLAGITKKRNNKLSLTKKGKTLFESTSKANLLKEIFAINIQKFNLGYHDGYPDETGIQGTFGYTLYLLLKYGKEQRPLRFYTDKQILAFPHELENFEPDGRSPFRQYQNCFAVRVFERFLAYYGVIEYNSEFKYTQQGKVTVRATDLFYDLFELRNNNLIHS